MRSRQKITVALRPECNAVKAGGNYHKVAGTTYITNEHERSFLRLYIVSSNQNIEILLKVEVQNNHA